MTIGVLFLCIALLAWCIAPVVVCHSMAKQKGRDPGLWALLGLICGWIGVAILAIATPQPGADR